jgi:hypothetical protein
VPVEEIGFFTGDAQKIIVPETQVARSSFLLACVGQFRSFRVLASACTRGLKTSTFP